MKKRLGKNTFYTTEDLFQEIKHAVSLDSKWPVDYGVSAKPVDIWDYRFHPEFILLPGSNEGFYLVLGIRGIIGLEDTESYTRIGTIKTLMENDEGIRIMSSLYGEILIAYRKLIEKHLDDMTRKGFDLDFYNNEGFCHGYSVIASIEKAKTRALGLMEKYPQRYSHAIIRDNLTRKEIRIFPDGSIFK